MDLGLTDKVAIVTGSSRGLGAACAAALVKEGCRVTICARGDAQLAGAAAALRTLVRADTADPVLPIVADVASADGVHEVVDRTVATYGGIDILVNNVGLARGGAIVD